jgi:NADP-dependent 3-hydroxy acid dehydrogenase YdfG
VLFGSTSEAVIGAVEELAQSSRTITLVQDTFETNFFANVNIIKAVLPIMRERKNGHIIMSTGISSSPLPIHIVQFNSP